MKEIKSLSTIFAVCTVIGAVQVIISRGKSGIELISAAIVILAIERATQIILEEIRKNGSQ